MLLDYSVLFSTVAVLIHIPSLALGKGFFYYNLTNSCDLPLCSNRSDRERGPTAVSKHLVICFAQFLAEGYLEPCRRLPFCQLSQARDSGWEAKCQNQGTLLPTSASISSTEEEATIQDGVQLTCKVIQKENGENGVSLKSL